MISRIPEEYGNKFRFCVVAGMRATQIQGGALSMLETGSDKPAFIAIKEAEANLIKWNILMAVDQVAPADEEG
jgi:DNA-directed RNA polymerase omega subunit